jgi:hypothetical protein
MKAGSQLTRRDFVLAGLAGGALVCGPLAPGAARSDRVVALVLDPLDPVAAAGPARWALGELQRSLTEAGRAVRRLERIEQAGTDDLCIVASGGGAPVAAAALRLAGVSLPRTAESLALVAGDAPGRRAMVACGADVRGLVYALLELSDRVRHGLALDAALAVDAPIVEQPANAVRSVMRQFTSEMLDKPWFYDREMWPSYLTMLATHRFNRLHLAFGLGYDFLQRVADSYLLFPYPFLVSVPSYAVRATNLPDAERDRNLDTLRFISDETVARGLDFQLGVWMHGYGLVDSPGARYRIEGLTAETHAAYCRDALTAVLRACPAISAVALRIHGESGVAEGSYDFWNTVFDGVTRCGRAVEIDLHAKGIDARMIGGALATGMPVNVSPKFWAEHLGLPYHQAAIRELEMPVAGRTGAGLMTLSEGTRSFTRYGYADLLRDDRTYTVRHRVFSGTQRLLAWGDPAAAAAYARAFQFCGSTGADLMEPLTCRGRRGTGVGTRIGYADERLVPRWDWEKYTYWYRTWGRLTYDPQAAPDVWHREFGGDSGARRFLESSLARASRILPIVTTAYLPSAACDAYWPEIYWNQPMVREVPGDPYFDTPSPRTFQHASPLDPQLFSRMSDFADELLQGERTGKYSPVDVAQWLEDCAEDAKRDRARAGPPESTQVSRLAIDVDMLAGLGAFFGAKLRGGVLYAIHERSGDRRALEEALTCYRRARAAWAALVERAAGVYAADLSASDRISERGQWVDRLPAIDADIALMAERLASVTSGSDPRAAAAVAEVLARPRREPPGCTHRPPAGFRPREAIAIELFVESGRAPTAAHLRYRHVNQAERYATAEMEPRGDGYVASIPATYTDSPYPLQYYFELRSGRRTAWLYPGFAPDLMNQPYFVLRRL